MIVQEAPVFHPGASFKAIQMKYQADDTPDRDLSCSIEWCKGHNIQEAGTWDELIHSTRETDLLQAVARPGVEGRLGVLSIQSDVGNQIYVVGAIEGQLSLEEGRALAERLRAAAFRLEAYIDQHPGA